jgi:uncharacterized coiled-coil protein SlyX
MPKWLEALRNGYDTGRAQYGGRPMPQPPGQPEWAQPEVGEDDHNGLPENFGQPEFEPQMDAPAHPDTQRVAEQAREIEELRTTVADLNGEIARLEAQRVADTQRMEALTEAAAQLRGHLGDAVASCEPVIEVLKLPGVRKWLLEKFHPDKYSGANPAQREALENAAALINAAYDVVKQQAAPREE